MTEAIEDGAAMIAQMYRDGVTVDEIKRRCGVGSGTITAALAAHGVQLRRSVWRAKSKTAHPDVAAIEAMLEGIIKPPQGVTRKGAMMLGTWVDMVVCPICRVLIWPEVGQHENIDGATFCCNPYHACDCDCNEMPRKPREDAFRAYVTMRLRELEVIEAQDAPVAAARYNLEKERGVMPTAVTVRL